MSWTEERRAKATRLARIYKWDATTLRQAVESEHHPPSDPGVFHDALRLIGDVEKEAIA